MNVTTEMLIGATGGAVAAFFVGLAIGRRLYAPPGGETQARLERLGVRQLLQQLVAMTDALSTGVATQRSRIDALYNRLQSMDLTGSTVTHELIDEVLAEIRNANERMQDQLTAAEIQLQQQAALIESHASQAMTDALTRLPNRRALDEDLERRFAAWQRRGTPLSLLLVDVDHFKQVNDTCGHAAGDKVLRQVALVLRRSLRSMDMVARYGGEEFAVVLPETMGRDAEAAARHVLEAMRSASFPVDDGRLQVTVSVGLASVRPDEQSEDLVKRADEALYASKRNGRDCGHYHDGLVSQRIADVDEGATLGEGRTSPQSVTEALAELDQVREQLRNRVSEVTEGK